MTVSSATGLASTAPAPARNHVEVPELRRTATPRGLGWAAFLTAVALVVFDQIDLLVRYSSRWTTIDQTLLWDATRELRAGHLSEPYFYGQRYGTVWETLPAVLLRALGLGPATAVPLATSLCVVGGWLVVAAAAWRIGHRRLAMLLPLVLLAASTRYLVLLSAPRGVGAGMLLASLAVAAFLLARDHPAGLTALVGLGSVAALFDLGSLLVVAPLIAYAVVRERKDPTLLRRLGLALVPAAVWLLGTTAFYQRHPSVGTQWYTGGYQPSLCRLIDGLRRLPDFAHLFGPALLPGPVVPCLVTVVVLLALGLTRRPAALAAGATFTVVVLLTLASPKGVQSWGYTYMPPGRLLLSLPLALWVLGYLLVRERDALRWSFSASHLVHRSLWVLALAGLFTAGVRTAHLTDQIGVVASPDRLGNRIVALTPSAEIEAGCRELAAAQRRLSVSTVVFRVRGEQAYACDALRSGPPAGVIVPVDRRVWTAPLLSAPTRRLLVVSDRPPTCAPGTALACRPLGDQLWFLNSALPVAPQVILHLAGLESPITVPAGLASCFATDTCTR